MKYVVKIAWRDKDGREKYRTEIVSGRMHYLEPSDASRPPSLEVLLSPLSLGKGERVVQISEAGYQL